MQGWCGRIGVVDLGSGAVEVQRPAPDLLARVIGGKGLAGHLLFGEATRAWDDPDLPLIFATGPLVATSAPTSGRMTVMSRSPLTGTIADASVGGRLGTELKRAGWDALVIVGRANRPTRVHVEDLRITLHDASELVGLPVSARTAHLEGQGAVATIGPSAEAGVRFASLVVDRHYFAGRGGLGLVAAARNLGALTARGSGKVSVADPAGLKEAREDIVRLVNASPILMGELGIHRYGTGALYDLMGSRCMMPTANFRRTAFEAAAGMNAHAYEQAYQPHMGGCHGCHVRCKKEGKGGERLPEFETMSHFSALLENERLDVVVAANTICNEAGMDTISAGATLACHAEIEGVRFGPEQVLALFSDLAAARGVGADLAVGARAYAAARGAPEAAMTVKGLELPAYDPRGAYGMALGFAVSTRGGCHLRAYPVANEILRKPVPTDRFAWSGKARQVAIAEDAHAVVDSLTACKFLFFAASLEEYARAYAAVTGVPATGYDLLRLGAGIDYAERVMNARNGFGAADDDLPSRFFEQAGSSGAGVEVPALSRADFEEARARYYRIRGLDGQGRPTAARAAELGVPWSA